MDKDRIELIKANENLTANMTNLLEETVSIAMVELSKLAELIQEVHSVTKNSMDKTN